MSKSLMSLITSCEADPSVCEGVQVFCRVGHVVRKNTSTYKLTVSVYGSTKSIMLHKGREMCISHRPSQPSTGEETDHDIFQRIHKKSILHEDIHIKVSEANLPGDVENEWRKIIGTAGSYLTNRIATIEIPGHISASVLVGVHHYDLLPPSWIGSRDATESYFIGQERSTKKAIQRKMFNMPLRKRNVENNGDKDATMIERVKIVEETAHHLVPDFVPISSNESNRRTKNGDVLWYREGSRSLTGRGGPQPYTSYNAFLHNRLNREWLKGMK